MEVINIAIIEDKESFRKSLQLILDDADHYQCIGAFANGKAALSGIRNQQPDVVLTDLGLPDISGIECIRVLKKEFPEVQFMVVSVADDEEQIFEALTAGAEGYLTKDAGYSGIMEGLKDLINGGAPMSASIARKTLSFFNKPTKELAQAYQEKLGKREVEVLEQLIKGLSYKEIGQKMFIGIETVKSHCHNIYKKLHVKSKEALISKVYSNDPLVFKLQEEKRMLEKRIVELENLLHSSK